MSFLLPSDAIIKATQVRPGDNPARRTRASRETRRANHNPASPPGVKRPASGLTVASRLASFFPGWLTSVPPGWTFREGRLDPNGDRRWSSPMGRVRVTAEGAQRSTSPHTRDRGQGPTIASRPVSRSSVRRSLRPQIAALEELIAGKTTPGIGDGPPGLYRWAGSAKERGSRGRGLEFPRRRPASRMLDVSVSRESRLAEGRR